MGDGTHIEWADASWNPIRARDRFTGQPGWFCEILTPGCEHCYAASINHRLGTGGRYLRKDREKYDIYLDEKILTQPRRWKQPRRIFVCSMSDLFGEFVPDEFIDRLFAMMALCPQHQFLVLTKRAERMRDYCSDENTPFRVAKAIDKIQVTEEMVKITEETRPIIEYPGYYVSNTGKIFSSTGSAVCLHCGNQVDGLASKQYCSKKCRQNAVYHRRMGRKPRFESQLTEMSPDIGEKGHRRVQLYRDGTPYRELVHRLVLTAFVGPPVGNEQGCHRGSDPENNHIANLRWGMQTDNWDERRRHGKGRSFAKLRPKQIKDIKERASAGQTFIEIAKAFSVTDVQIHNIVSQKQWAVMPPIEWPLNNCWTGCSVEDQRRADERIPLLIETPAAMRWISAEPLLGPVELWNMDEGVLRGCAVIRSGGVTPSTPNEPPEGYDDSYPGIDWAVVGGESGPGARPFNVEWARSIIAQCRTAAIPCFVKQLGAFPIDKFGLHPKLRDRKGGDPTEWSEDLRVREYPAPGAP